MKHLLRISLKDLPRLGDILKHLDRSRQLVKGAEMDIGLNDSIPKGKAELHTYAVDGDGSVTGDSIQITIRKRKG